LPMEPEDKRMLKRVLELSENNNKMIRKLYRSFVLQRIITVLYWVLIIGVTIGLYYYLQPFFDQVSKIYSDITGVQVNLGESFNSFFQK